MVKDEHHCILPASKYINCLLASNCVSMEKIQISCTAYGGPASCTSGKGMSFHTGTHENVRCYCRFTVH